MVFGKTLINAEKAIKKNNFRSALEIINEHLNTDHALTGNANRLVRDVALLQHDLITLQMVLGELAQRPSKIMTKELAIEALDSAKRNLKALRSACNVIIREERLEE